MGKLSGTQKYMAREQYDALRKQREEGVNGTDFLDEIEKQAKDAIKELSKIKDKYKNEKNPDVLADFDATLGKAAGNIAMLYKYELGRAGKVARTFKDTLEKKFGVPKAEYDRFMKEISAPAFDSSIQKSDSDKSITAEQLDAEEAVAEKEKVNEEPKIEVPKKEEPKPRTVPEPEPEVKKEQKKSEPAKAAWEYQTNLPKVKTTIPTKIADAVFALAKDKNGEHKFESSHVSSETAKNAIGTAFENRAKFQANLDPESREAFMGNLATALFEYGRLTLIMTDESMKAVTNLKGRFKNQFGISEDDLKKLANGVYNASRGIGKGWKADNNELAEERLLKIGAPDLTNLSPKADEVPEIDKEDKIRITVDLDEKMPGDVKEEPKKEQEPIEINEEIKPAPEEREIKPDMPQISSDIAVRMKAFYDANKGRKTDDISNEAINLALSLVNKTNGKSKDESIAKLLGMGGLLKGKDNTEATLGFIANAVKGVSAIPDSEIECATDALTSGETNVFGALLNLKQTEFENRYKVPESVKNFKYSKEMIGANKEFLNNNYEGFKKGDFMAFARRHYETLENSVKNPPEQLTEGGANNDPKAELYSASVGMYSRVRAAFDNRKWYDVLFHPIDSYREYSLMNKMKNTLSEGGMNDEEIENLYNESKEVFGVDKLSNGDSLNGKVATRGEEATVGLEEPDFLKNKDQKELKEDLNEQFKTFGERDGKNLSQRQTNARKSTTLCKT